MVGKKERRYQWMLTLAMGLISLIMIIPLVLLVMASLTSNNEIIMHGYSFWPKQFSLEAYQYIWNEKAQIYHLWKLLIVTAVADSRNSVAFALWLCFATSDFPRQFPVFYHAV